jgi:signal transduction histidine kinase
MHDELGQVLTALKMDLSIVGKDIAEDKLQNPAQIQQEIDCMLKLIDSTIKKIRTLITQLRPEVLDNLGLIPALEWHAQEIGTRTGMKHKFRSNMGEIELNKELATAVFRIFQEALTNIVRHAKATRFDMYLAMKNGTISLKISDNGIGITTDNLENSQTFGLLGMKERALVLGGAVEVSGTKGKGTTVLARIPIR